DDSQGLTLTEGEGYIAERPELAKERPSPEPERLLEPVDRTIIDVVALAHFVDVNRGAVRGHRRTLAASFETMRNRATRWRCCTACTPGALTSPEAFPRSSAHGPVRSRTSEGSDTAAAGRPEGQP